jgi:hypothetical protein
MKASAQPLFTSTKGPSGIAKILPEIGLIGWSGKIADMIMIWKVFRGLISQEP